MASVRIVTGVAIGLSLAGCAARETAKVAPPPVRKTFCVAADQVLADIAATTTGDFDVAAPKRLDQLNEPFIAFFRAYDAWRLGTMVPVQSLSAPLTVATTAQPGVATAPQPRVLSSQPVPAAKPYTPAPAINPPSLSVNPAALQ